MKLFRKQVDFKTIISIIKKGKPYYAQATLPIISILIFAFAGKEKSSLPAYPEQKSDFVISVTESSKLIAASNFVFKTKR
jgi:hypothetical protein